MDSPVGSMDQGLGGRTISFEELYNLSYLVFGEHWFHSSITCWTYSTWSAKGGRLLMLQTKTSWNIPIFFFQGNLTRDQFVISDKLHFKLHKTQLTFVWLPFPDWKDESTNDEIGGKSTSLLSGALLWRCTAHKISRPKCSVTMLGGKCWVDCASDKINPTHVCCSDAFVRSAQQDFQPVWKYQCTPVDTMYGGLNFL